MSLALDDHLASPVSAPSRPGTLVVADGDSRPVFVDESGRRARWCQRLLGACTLVALGFMLTVTVLGVAFARSAGCDSWAGPDRLDRSTAVSTATVPSQLSSAHQLSSAPRCRS
jgi:hypothetical protein